MKRLYLDSKAKDRVIRGAFKISWLRREWATTVPVSNNGMAWHGVTVMNAGIFMKRGRAGERRKKIQREELQPHFARTCAESGDKCI